MVLALTISPQIGIDKSLILSLTFGVVFFSLVFQGLSMGPLLKLLKLTNPLKDTHDYQLMVARLVSLAGADKEIEKLYDSKIISRKIYKELKKEVTNKREEKEKLIEDMLAQNKELEDSQIAEARKAILIAKKSAVIKGMKEGLFEEEIGEELIARIDKKLIK
jgi:CPA1 family monovalent cation:H+ antiporter